MKRFLQAEVRRDPSDGLRNPVALQTLAQFFDLFAQGGVLQPQIFDRPPEESLAERRMSILRPAEIRNNTVKAHGREQLRRLAQPEIALAGPPQKPDPWSKEPHGASRRNCRASCRRSRFLSAGAAGAAHAEQRGHDRDPEWINKRDVAAWKYSRCRATPGRASCRFPVTLPKAPATPDRRRSRPPW